VVWVYLAELALAVLLVCWQFAWPTWLELLQQPPDLAAVLLVAVGLTRGPLEGCWCGLLSALMAGALGPAPLGGLFISHMGAGTVLGLLGGRIFPDQVPVAMVVTAITVLIMSLVEALFWPPPGLGPWLAATVSQTVISALVAAPLFALLRPVMHYLAPPGQRRA